MHATYLLLCLLTLVGIACGDVVFSLVNVTVPLNISDYGGHKNCLVGSELLYEFGGATENKTGEFIVGQSAKYSAFFGHLRVLNLTSGVWTMLSSEPDPRAWMSLSCTEDYLYLYGGFRVTETGATIYDDFWSYRFSTDAWSLLTNGSAPGPRAGPISIVYQNKFIVYGGTDEQFFDRNTTWIYDLGTALWSELTTSVVVPFGNINPMYTVFKKQLFVYGGEYRPLDPVPGIWRYRNEIWVLNLKTLQWSLKEDSGIYPLRSYAWSARGNKWWNLGGGDCGVWNNTDAPNNDYIVNEVVVQNLGKANSGEWTMDYLPGRLKGLTLFPQELKPSAIKRAWASCEEGGPCYITGGFGGLECAKDIDGHSDVPIGQRYNNLVFRYDVVNQYVLLDD